jgi:hypothetical protein
MGSLPDAESVKFQIEQRLAHKTQLPAVLGQQELCHLGHGFIAWASRVAEIGALTSTVDRKCGAVPKKYAAAPAGAGKDRAKIKRKG